MTWNLQRIQQLVSILLLSVNYINKQNTVRSQRTSIIFLYEKDNQLRCYISTQTTHSSNKKAMLLLQQVNFNIYNTVNHHLPYRCKAPVVSHHHQEVNVNSRKCTSEFHISKTLCNRVSPFADIAYITCDLLLLRKATKL